jgi:hypothetical protein
MVALTLQDANCIGVRAHVWSIIANAAQWGCGGSTCAFFSRTQTLPRVKTRLSVTPKGDKGHAYPKHRLLPLGSADRSPFEAILQPPCQIAPTASPDNTTFVILANDAQHS